MCNKLKISKLQVLFGFIFCFFLSSQSHALMKNTCALANSNELSPTCQEKTNLLATLNEDFKKSLFFGQHCLIISLLVIVPNVSIETPKALTSKIRSISLNHLRTNPLVKKKTTWYNSRFRCWFLSIGKVSQSCSKAARNIFPSLKKNCNIRKTVQVA